LRKRNCVTNCGVTDISELNEYPELGCQSFNRQPSHLREVHGGAGIPYGTFWQRSTPALVHEYISNLLHLTYEFPLILEA
jgi:hypothetical protein